MRDSSGSSEAKRRTTSGLARPRQRGFNPTFLEKTNFTASLTRACPSKKAQPRLRFLWIN
jgi:hypothetical protein